MSTPPIAPSEPASTPTAKRPWYRRRATIVGAGVAVLVAVTVVTDLPGGNTRSSEVTTSREIIAEIASDVQPCNLGLTESLGFYSDVTTGHITAQHRAQIPGLITQDLEACSYTNSGIDDLASIDLPSSKYGKELNTITNNALNWCDPDALGAIKAITTLIDHPTDASAKSSLAHAETFLAEDRAATFRNVAHLAKELGASMHSGIRLEPAPTPSAG